jgi:hypothetical protein
MRSRVIQTDNGAKTIIKTVFSIWNPKIQRDQLFELSRKWAKRAIAAMMFYNTTTLIVERKGSGLVFSPTLSIYIRFFTAASFLGLRIDLLHNLS